MSRIKLSDIDKFPAHIAAHIRNQLAASPSNMESHIANEHTRKNLVEALDTPVYIHVHSIRRKLADIDNISGKAAIDGCVNCGLLSTDSPEEVLQISHTQEKAKEEKTIIRFYKP